MHLGCGKIEIQQQIGIKLVLTSTTAYYNNWTSDITLLLGTIRLLLTQARGWISTKIKRNVKSD